MKKTKNDTNTKKIVAELFLIPLCIAYLYYELLHNHPKINIVFLYLTTIITCFEFIVKYIHEVYVYKNRYNFLKIIYTIISFMIIIFTFLNIFLKYEIVSKIYVVLLIIMLCYLLYFAINNIVKIIKEKGRLFTNAVSSFFSLISFGIVLIGIIIFL